MNFSDDPDRETAPHAAPPMEQQGGDDVPNTIQRNASCSADIWRDRDSESLVTISGEARLTPPTENILLMHRSREINDIKFPGRSFRRLDRSSILTTPSAPAATDPAHVYRNEDWGQVRIVASPVKIDGRVHFFSQMNLETFLDRVRDMKDNKDLPDVCESNRSIIAYCKRDTSACDNATMELRQRRLREEAMLDAMED
ncbi:hypothetical protein ACP4OV_027867 [Aristida adscensionis]